MFDEPPRRSKKRRTPSPRSVTRAKCPKCLTAMPVGLIRVGEHLVWREHYITTWGGARRPCPASGVAVCALPPKDNVSNGVGYCKHGPEGGDADGAT
jgi:hypothetical protein